MTDGNVYAVASGKGGVGKTTTAVNLGAAFVEAGRSVVVVDVDLGMANLEDFLAAEPGAATLHDVLAGDASIEEAIVPAPGEFDVVFGSPDIEAYGRANPAKLGDAVESLRERYDVVLLDGGGGLSHDVTVPLGLADGIILVTTPSDAAITNVEKTKALVERLDGSIEGVIVTRIGGAGRATPEVVSDRIDVSVLGAVPEDGAIQMSMDEGTPLVSIDRESPAAQSYREIAYGLLGEPLPRDWAEESENPVGATVGGGPDLDEPESAAADDPAESETASATGEQDDPAAAEPVAEGDGDPADDAEDDPAASGESADLVAAEADDGALEDMNGSAAELEDTQDVTDAELDEEPTAGDASDERPAAGIADRLESMEGEETVDSEAASGSASDAPPGSASAAATEATDSAEQKEPEGGSFIMRLFGGLFG